VVEMERNTVNKKEQQTESKSIMQLVEEVDVPVDVDRRMDEVMEDMEE
jgi:hypothetical protein